MKRLYTERPTTTAVGLLETAASPPPAAGEATARNLLKRITLPMTLPTMTSEIGIITPRRSDDDTSSSESVETNTLLLPGVSAGTEPGTVGATGVLPGVGRGALGTEPGTGAGTVGAVPGIGAGTVGALPGISAGTSAGAGTDPGTGAGAKPGIAPGTGTNGAGAAPGTGAAGTAPGAAPGTGIGAGAGATGTNGHCAH